MYQTGFLRGTFFSFHQAVSAPGEAGLHSFCRGKKIFFSPVHFFMEGSGGIPISPLRTLQTTRNPLETAAVGARRPRRGATPDNPARKCKHDLPDWAYRSGFHQTELFGEFFLYPSDHLSPRGKPVAADRPSPSIKTSDAPLPLPIGLGGQTSVLFKHLGKIALVGKARGHGDVHQTVAGAAQQTLALLHPHLI